ncbi:hypothetical protein KIPB_005047 [Kipferlia bialata]|uniref:Uncharacterized protein n=1 Tax=Kipferlia bialata TaxID=797122 RepID=A0A9K3CW21_9EUKA|nr:hypothetical protein KIPB_005047 [Kipferlia bialata]|eukprot:g5047.t1
MRLAVLLVELILCVHAFASVSSPTVHVWEQDQLLMPLFAESGLSPAGCGSSVAVDGDWLVSGCVTYNHYRDPIDPYSSLLFGTAVAASHSLSLIAVGIPYYETQGVEAGEVHLYSLEGSTWVRLCRIPLPTEAHKWDAQFGAALSFADDRLVISSTFGLWYADAESGWDMAQKVALPSGTNYGSFLSYSNGILAAGFASSTVVIDDERLQVAGKVAIYDTTVPDWYLEDAQGEPEGLVQVLSSPKPTDNGFFGGALAIDVGVTSVRLAVGERYAQVPSEIGWFGAQVALRGDILTVAGAPFGFPGYVSQFQHDSAYMQWVSSVQDWQGGFYNETDYFGECLASDPLTDTILVGSSIIPQASGGPGGGVYVMRTASVMLPSSSISVQPYDISPGCTGSATFSLFHTDETLYPHDLLGRISVYFMGPGRSQYGDPQPVTYSGGQNQCEYRAHLTVPTDPYIVSEDGKIMFAVWLDGQFVTSRTVWWE